MSSPFSRTLRSLDADGFRRSAAAVGLVALLLAGWGVWLAGGRVHLYEVGPVRLEVDAAVHPVEAPVGGRVAAVHMRLDEPVLAGQLLLELDTEDERLTLEEQQARQQALTGQLTSLRAELAAELQALEEMSAAGRARFEEVRAEGREAEIAARFAEDDAERKARLRAGGQIPELELLRAKAEAERLRAAAETLRIRAGRVEAEQRIDVQNRRARVAGLERESARVAGEIAGSAVSLQRLQQQLERHRVRAPVAGRLGDVSTLRLGGVLQPGDRVASVVPPGRLKAVALFPAAEALGRIRPGQPARLRLDGFPWTVFGSLAASVSAVAAEPRGGRVQVELELHPDAASRIPLQHGLIGVVEVDVEQVSPLTLALRSAGRLVSGAVLSAGNSEALPTISVTCAGHPVIAELAATPEHRERGLMFRTEVAEGSGMLFVFAAEMELSFWMRNTFVPLSIAFLDAAGTILNVEDLEPLDETMRRSAGPARYALEVPQGWFAARRIGAGQRCELRLPPGLPVE
jgi:multidrug resistance efflux pump/uncharacterized membrane protein (UPF0127 family)